MIRQYSYVCVATAYYSIILIHKEIADETLLREENSPLQSYIVIAEHSEADCGLLIVTYAW